MNTFGHILRLTTFGESHGVAMGGVLDGFPAGHEIDFGIISELLSRRRPGTSPEVTARQEADEPEFLSGIDSAGVSLGSPIAFIVRNRDHRPADYSEIEHLYRPNHADYTYMCRYGIRDPRGGGRASARDTVSRVIAGGIALSYLRSFGINIESRLESVGGITGSYSELMQIVREAAANADSVGGTVLCTATGVPAGIGNPVFGKLNAEIASALMGINGVKGVEYGDGFQAADSYGSMQADTMSVSPSGQPIFNSNHSGGIQGGISNGMPVTFRIAFKPTPTIGKELATITESRQPVIMHAHGRHDPCIAIRGAVVCEAMMALAIADSLLSSTKVVI